MNLQGGLGFDPNDAATAAGEINKCAVGTDTLK